MAKKAARKKSAPKAKAKKAKAKAKTKTRKTARPAKRAVARNAAPPEAAAGPPKLTGPSVVHWEVQARDPGAQMRFFGELFGWNVDANNPQNYGMVTPAGSDCWRWRRLPSLCAGAIRSDPLAPRSGNVGEG